MKRIVSLILVLCTVLALIPAFAAAQIEATKIGDTDGDGSITAGDASMVLRFLVRLISLSEQQWANADANQDGDVTSADAAVILRGIVKLDTIPPSGPVVTLPPTLPKAIFVDTILNLTVGAVSKLRYTSNVPVLPPLTWLSSVPEVATVDQSGTVRTLSVGSTEIYADAEGGARSICIIRVTEGPRSIQLVNLSFPRSGELVSTMDETRDFNGIISSETAILSIECSIINLQTNETEQKAVYGGGATSRIVLANVEGYSINPAELDIGPKRAVISCTNTKETVELYNAYFTVTDESSTLTPTLLSRKVTKEAYYGLYNTQTTWTEASHWALCNGSTLATVGSEQENVLIRALVEPFGHSCWLGASRQTEDDWRWTVAQPFGYANWAVGQPSADAGKVSYLSMLGNSTDISGAVQGQWASAENDDPLVTGFIIESPLVRLSVALRQVEFQVGSSFKPNRHLYVFAGYANGVEIEVSDYELSDTTLDTVGKKAITVSYGGFSTTFFVTVSEEVVLSGTGFKECEQLPFPQDYERLEHGEKFNLHGKVYSEDAILSVTLTLINEESGKNTSQTIFFEQDDNITEVNLEKEVEGTSGTCLDELMQFDRLGSGSYKMYLKVVTADNPVSEIIASGSFQIRDSGTWKQLTYRKFAHSYQSVLEFFGGEGNEDKFLFKYKWITPGTRYIERDPEWNKKYLTSVTGHNGSSWTVHVDAKPYFERAVAYLKNTYVRVYGTNGDSGVILLSKLIEDKSGPTVSRYQSDLKDISQHALGTAVDINHEMSPNTNSYSNKAVIINDVNDHLTYNGIKTSGSKTYYEFYYNGSYKLKYNDVPETCLNYLIYELAFFRAEFRWGLYFSHTSDAMHFSLTESELIAHEPEEGGLRKVYEYIN